MKVTLGVPKESIKDVLINCKTAPKTRPYKIQKLDQANGTKSRSGKRARVEEIHEFSDSKISKIVKAGALCSCCPSTSTSSKAVH